MSHLKELPELPELSELSGRIVKFVREMYHTIDKHFYKLWVRVDARIDEVEAKLDKLGNEFERRTMSMDSRDDTLEGRLEFTHNRLNKVVAVSDHHDSRLKVLEESHTMNTNRPFLIVEVDSPRVVHCIGELDAHCRVLFDEALRLTIRTMLGFQDGSNQYYEDAINAAANTIIDANGAQE